MFQDEGFSLQIVVQTKETKEGSKDMTYRIAKSSDGYGYYPYSTWDGRDKGLWIPAYLYGRDYPTLEDALDDGAVILSEEEDRAALLVSGREVHKVTGGKLSS